MFVCLVVCLFVCANGVDNDPFVFATFLSSSGARLSIVGLVWSCHAFSLSVGGWVGGGGWGGVGCGGIITSLARLHKRDAT